MDYLSQYEVYLGELDAMEPAVSQHGNSLLQPQCLDNTWPHPTNSWPSNQITPELSPYCVMQPSLSTNLHDLQTLCSPVPQISPTGLFNVDTSSLVSSQNFCQCNGCDPMQVLCQLIGAEGSISSDLQASITSATTSAMSQDMNEDDDLNALSLQRSPGEQAWSEQSSCTVADEKDEVDAIVPSTSQMQRKSCITGKKNEKRRISHRTTEKNYRLRISHMLMELRLCIENAHAGEVYRKKGVDQKDTSGKFAVVSDAIQYIELLQSKNRSLTEKVTILRHAIMIAAGRDASLYSDVLCSGLAEA